MAAVHIPSRPFKTNMSGPTWASNPSVSHVSAAVGSGGVRHSSYAATSQHNTTGSSYAATSQQNIQSERIVSSSIVGEQQLGAAPEDTVQYVEVPVIEEVVRHVPKKEIVEVEKRVPRYEYEWVERIVEVPQVQMVDKHVEVPQIQEVVKHVPVKQYVDVPKEVVRYVPKIETKIVEQEVEVAGETIEVPKPYLVENKVVVPRYADKEVPTVIAQRLHPVITESETDFVDVELKEYNPHLIPVDVYLPRPVARNLIAAAKSEEHRVVDIPAAQYNSLVKNLNQHIQDKDAEGLFVKLADGSIPMLHGMGSSLVPPVSSEWEKFHVKGQQHVQLTSTAATTGATSTAGGYYSASSAQSYNVIGTASNVQQYHPSHHPYSSSSHLLHSGGFVPTTSSRVIQASGTLASSNATMQQTGGSLLPSSFHQVSTATNKMRGTTVLPSSTSKTTTTTVMASA